MAFNINDFKSQGLAFGGARPSLFQVQFPSVPSGLVVNGVADQQLSYLVQASSLPASIVDQIEVPYFGRRVKYAGERVFQDWTCTVMNDEDFVARDFFESWSNKINSMLGNMTTGGLVAYKVDNTSVLQYGKDGSIIRSYAFFGLWPKTVSDIRLDWAQSAQMEVFDVQFALDYWLPVTADGQAGGASYTGWEPTTAGAASAPNIG
jgi:hypothetical protein